MSDLPGQGLAVWNSEGSDGDDHAYFVKQRVRETFLNYDPLPMQC